MIWMAVAYCPLRSGSHSAVARTSPATRKERMASPSMAEKGKRRLASQWQSISSAHSRHRDSTSLDHSDAHSTVWPSARQSGFAERRRPEPTMLPGDVIELGLDATGDECKVPNGVVGQNHGHAAVRSSRSGRRSASALLSAGSQLMSSRVWWPPR